MAVKTQKQWQDEVSQLTDKLLKLEISEDRALKKVSILEASVADWREKAEEASRYYEESRVDCEKFREKVEYLVGELQTVQRELEQVRNTQPDVDLNSKWDLVKLSVQVEHYQRGTTCKLIHIWPDGNVLLAHLETGVRIRTHNKFIDFIVPKASDLQYSDAMQADAV